MPLASSGARGGFGRCIGVLVAASIALSFAYSATAAPPDKNGKVAYLAICVDVDGGILADRAADGTPIIYGETAATRWNSTIELTSDAGSASISVASGGCLQVGEFPATGKNKLTVKQVGPRFDAGISTTAFDTEPPKALLSWNISARSVIIKPREGTNTLTVSERFVCTTNWSNGNQYGGYCQDVVNGISNINVLSETNCTIAINDFATGTTEPIAFVVTTPGTSSGNWRLEAISADGAQTELYMEF